MGVSRLVGLTGDTIAALATPGGAGGIGILRVSGPEALAVGERIFRPARAWAGTMGRAWPARRLVLGRAVDPADGQEIDEVLAVYFPAPHSYTTQATVEIQGHGGPAVMRRLLEAALAAGCRLARPGEFTWRAFVGGRLDLAQAEAVGALVAAQSRAEARLALAGLAGGLGARLEPVRESLLGAAARVEAALDFPEDLAALDAAALASDLRRGALEPLESLLGERARRRVFQEGALVVLCGRPNVGKSSLFNALLGRRRALVSAQPGTTRDLLEEPLVVGGVRVCLVDTAGLGTGGPEVEEAGREMARERLGQAELCLVVLDGGQVMQAEDWEVLAATEWSPRLLVVNKADKAPAWEPQELDAPFLCVSAHTGQGLEDLLAALGQALTGGLPEPAPGEALANARQAEAFVRVRGAVERALAALGLVDGRSAPDEVIEAAFANFCLGK